MDPDYSPYGAWAQSGVPLRHRKVADAPHIRYEDWGENADKAREVAEAVRGGGLAMLLGPFGTGKTQLAAWFVRACCFNQNKPAMYRRFADLLSEMRDECYERGGSDARLMARLARVRFMVIDELHHRRWSEDENLWLMRLLDHRYGAMTPTLLIANLTREAARDSLDGSIIDRMREGGAVVEFTGASRREPSNG
jgi:DNA replication protein DnaC